MKKFNLTAVFLLLFAGGVFAQDNDSTKSIKMEKEYTIMGKSWKVIKYEDGSKSYEWELDNGQYVHYHSEKSSKFQYNFLETEVGINIWPADKGAPQVKPWGSWFVSLQSVGTWKASKNFHLRSTLGVSWYNFKFEDRSIFAVKTPDGLEFVDYNQVINDPNAEPIKSKISASYAMLTVIPTVHTSNGKMRFGAGAYAGYRLGGRGKFVYESDGEKEKNFTKSNMYVENFRYGVRSEIGIGEVTLFFNYDLNDLFQVNKGPELQAMSFGLRVH
jgi:hypothetical protein